MQYIPPAEGAFSPPPDSEADSFEVFHVKRALAANGASGKPRRMISNVCVFFSGRFPDFCVTYNSPDACVMRFSAAQTRVSEPRAGGKERAKERERNAKAAALRMDALSDKQLSAARALPPGARLCIILQMPNISIARTAELVRGCSMQQGGGACDVMAVQADGQVLQFSVAAVEQLAPLHKSKRKRAQVVACSAARADAWRLQALSNTRKQAQQHSNALRLRSSTQLASKWYSRFDFGIYFENTSKERTTEISFRGNHRNCIHRIRNPRRQHKHFFLPFLTKHINSRLDQLQSAEDLISSTATLPWSTHTVVEP